ncbi:MAG: nucleotidyltransferase domain-containing protein [Thermodesulfovibrionia bacterium]|nr:nucleotidyltransferase domain-containing protein [Thermodesulfovibrionia bacterium]
MTVAERWKGYKELPEDVINRLEGIKVFWGKNSDIFLVYLFGSLVERKYANDVDLAILFNTKPSYERITELFGKLYKLLGTQKIDIVDLNRAGPCFKFNTIRSGKLLYMKDINTLNSFEGKVIKEHMDTEYLRKVQRWFLKEKALKSD